MTEHLHVFRDNRQVHNIDGPMLRNETSQTVLSMLAEIPRVHIIASIGAYSHIACIACYC